MPAVRLLFVDNLRWLMITLVVSMHAAVTFSGLGSWYYVEAAPLDPASMTVFAFYQSHLQAFFMGLLFLIAGYFVPGAYERKGPRRFLADRAVRLGVPTLLYVAVIQPSVSYYLCRVPRGGPFPSLASVGRDYYLGLRFLGGTGPMWFALALLVFCVVYAVVRRWGWPQPVSQTDAALPTAGGIGGLILVIALTAFLVRLVQPIGTSVWNLQLGFFAQYVFLFAVGILAWHRNWLLRLHPEVGRRWFWSAAVGGPVLWLGMMIMGRDGTDSFKAFMGGWRWQSAAYALWESFFGVAFSLGLLVQFRERFNHQGRLARLLSDNAFAVYVFHPPLLIAVTFLLRGPGLAPLLKFAVASVMGVAVCFLASHLVLRRIPGLRRVL